MALNTLAADPRMQRTRLVVIDFEALTPTGRSPVPVEVAAITVTLHPDGTLAELDRFESLMAPPPEVPITRFDEASGITRDLLRSAPKASAVMAELDQRIHAAAAETGHAALLVAHNAATERTLLHGQRQHCPHLAELDLLDTVRLARKAVPELTAHGLSDLARYFDQQIPADRHRAMADVQLTITVFERLLARGAWTTLMDLELIGHMPARKPPTAIAEQHGLF